MRKSILAVVCVALASCNPAEAPPEPVEATPATATTPAADDMAGTYEVTLADGSMVVETINADGTYVDMKDGVEAERGTWRAEGDRMCFDPDGDEPEACFGQTDPGPDGTFRAIGEDGEETGVTVRRIGPPAPPAATPPPSE